MLAAMSVESGRTDLNDQTDPSGFLSSGAPGGLDLVSVGSASGSISFTVNGPLPVVLSSFAALTAPGGTVTLRWKTSSEINNYGFLVERKAGKDSLFSPLQGSFVAGHGTTLQAQEYQWTDNSEPSPPLSYRLRQINLDGSVHFSESVSVDYAPAPEPRQVPAVFSLHQNYPNPFNPSTAIEFSVGRSGHATLTVFNSLGQSIGTLFNGDADPGRIYEVQFDGRNMASGVYFYRLESGGSVDSKRLLLLR
jgi:hypothetical protein